MAMISQTASSTQNNDQTTGTCPARGTLQKLGLGVIFAFTVKGLITASLLLITIYEFAH